MSSSPPVDEDEDARSLGRCIIVARGSVYLPSSITNGLVMAGGDIIVPDGGVVGAELRCCGKIIFLGKSRQKQIFERSTQQNNPKALDPFKFFELATVGLTAKTQSDKSISVSQVAVGSPLLKAGLAKGDVFLEVDGQAPKTEAELRRLLRTGYVRGEAKLKIRRGEATKELAAAFPLPEK